MVKKNTLRSLFLVLGLILPSLMLGPISPAAATCTIDDETDVVTCNSGTNFRVNVNEILTVAITRPNNWASGSINTLLTNKVGLSIVSNNPAGFTATMKSSSATPNLVSLTDGTSIIPTLASASATTSNFPANNWGYSIVNGNASAPTTYYQMVGSGGTPIEITKTTSAPTGAVTKDIYFAAKSGGGVVSGTYSNNVVISVVTGVIDENNPTTPTNPITPLDDPSINNNNSSGDTNHGNTANGAVVSTTITGDATTTTRTTESYAKPAGVTETTVANINSGNSLSTGLAITAGVSAAAGTIFFILAKRRKKDEDPDDGSESY